MRRVIAASLLAVAFVATAQTPVPGSASPMRSFIIDGHGWGHGRGMGQYGARAMAEAHVPWFKILSRYFVGTHLGKTRATSIRVLLDETPSIVVRGDANLSVRDAAGRLLTGSSSGRINFRLVRSGRSIDVYTSRAPDGPWRRVVSRTRGLLRVSAAHRIGIIGSHARWYRSDFEIRAVGVHSLDIVTEMPLERYVAEVLPREMPAAWPMAALQAQAVAVRTYAVHIMEEARARGATYDICSSTACQVFGGYARSRRTGGGYTVLEKNSTNRAVAGTAGVVLLWKGAPILAQYSSSTGGYTADGGYPYLAAKPDAWDDKAPMHSWTRTVSDREVQAIWPSLGPIQSIRVTARNGKGDFGGRADEVVVAGARGSISMSGTDLQYALDLPSNWFRITVRERGHIFKRDMGYGTRSPEVRFLQRRLRTEGVYPSNAPITTFFGPITRASLQRYQRAHGIRPTGFLGPITRGSLNASA